MISSSQASDDRPQNVENQCEADKAGARHCIHDEVVGLNLEWCAMVKSSDWANSFAEERDLLEGGTPRRLPHRRVVPLILAAFEQGFAKAEPTHDSNSEQQGNGERSAGDSS